VAAVPQLARRWQGKRSSGTAGIVNLPKELEEPRDFRTDPGALFQFQLIGNFDYTLRPDVSVFAASSVKLNWWTLH
jgi:hypothetical protein